MTSTNSGSPSSGRSGNVLHGGAVVSTNNRRRMLIHKSIPEVEQPNVDEYHAKIEVGQLALDSLFKQLNELSDQIGQMVQTNSDFNAKRSKLRHSLDAVQTEMDELEAEKNRVMTQIEESARAGQDMKTKIQKLKKSLGFQSNEEIDDKIKEIERLRVSKRMNVADENKLILQIYQLKKNKPLIAKYSVLEADANSHSQAAALPLRNRLEELRAILKEKQAQKRQLNDKFGQLLSARNEANIPLRELADQKDEIRKQIVDKRREINQYRDEMFRKKKEYDVYVTKINRAKGELRAEERKVRAVEKQKRELQDELNQIDEGFWSSELQLTQQTTTYLRKLVEKSKESTSLLPAKQQMDDQRPSPAAPEEDGMVVMMPRKLRGDEYAIAPTKMKTVRAKKNKKMTVSLEQPLVHDLSTLTDFQKLRVTAPLSLSECPAVLEVLEDRLQTLRAEQLKNADAVQKKRSELLAKLEALDFTGVVSEDPVAG